MLHAPNPNASVRACAELLYQALASPFGIVVQASPLERVRQVFYRARKEDPEFERIAILQSPLSPTDQLWLVKKVPDVQEVLPTSESDADPF